MSNEMKHKILQVIQNHNTSRRLVRVFGLLLILGLLVTLLVPAIQVHAYPILPEKYLGSVNINGAQAPQGTLVEAKINGVTYWNRHS